MKTAIVTGGAGFIGKALTTRLLRDCWEVTVIDDFSTHAKREYPEHCNLRFIEGRVQDSITHRVHVDAIFHLAGKVGPVGVLKHKGRIAIDTIEAAEKVAYWGWLYHCPVIDISTSEIYGSPDKTNAEDDPKVFPYPASARMEYAVGKLAAETMLLNRDGMDVRIIRPFNVAGPGQSPLGGFVLPRFAQQALANTDLTVYAPGTQRRSFTHIDDIIDGIVLLYESGSPGDVYNLGSPFNDCTMLELAREVIRYAGAGRVKIVDPVGLWGDTFKEAADKVPNASKAMKELGWMPIRTRADIVSDTVDYWRDHDTSLGRTGS
jgi:UDP-glucuronate decarboxylase